MRPSTFLPSNTASFMGPASLLGKQPHSQHVLLHHHHQRRLPHPPTATHYRSSTFYHRPAGLLFEHAADALDNARFTEAAAIFEEALVPPTYAHARVPLPPHWSLLQLQINLVECLLHGKQYNRAVAVARRLRTVLPRRSWGKLLWLESIALARMGLYDIARDVYSSAFLQQEHPCVPPGYHATMHTSLLIALGAVDVDTRMPTPPDMHRGNAACDPAYPFVTVCDDSVVVDGIFDGGQQEQPYWSRDACVRYMLFGNPHAAL